MRVGADYVRDVIHALNERGFDALDPEWSGGRPRAIDSGSAGRICAIAKADPRVFGLPFSCGSLVKLRDHLVSTGQITPVSVETLRRVLRPGGVSWQATKTWKASNDPEFVPKMRRVLGLYDHPPVDGRVICVDEFGPLNLQPRAGKAWHPENHPVRLRATYHRTQGVRHIIAGLDLATGKLFYRIRDRKRWREFLSFLTSLRTRWAGQRLYHLLRQISFCDS
jgi:transposase